MQKFNAILLLMLVIALSSSAFAQADSMGNMPMPKPFTLAGNTKKTLKQAELWEARKGQTNGAKSENTLTFTEKTIWLVVTTGPEDDMLSYRIQGLRNPALVVPSGATLKILFVNTDGDMTHDIRLGADKTAFELAPEVAETIGTAKLAHENEGTLTGEEIVVKAETNGVFAYFCSVRGHAKGGMFGKIFVGEKPSISKADDQPKEAEMKMGDMEMPPADKMPEMKMPPEEKKTANKKPPQEMPEMPEMSGMKEMPAMNHGGHGETMRSVVNLNDSMARESSGTAWNADTSPMYGVMKMDGEAMLMFHGSMFLRYKNVGSSREVSASGKGKRERFDAPSMFMAMYSRPVSRKSQIGFRAMLSLDPIIERGYGYPLLYQSGENYRGAPLHDRQHPHDFVSELSATYSYSFNDKQSAYIYAGYPGEPALGPPTFMHRLSALNNPDAPISHHWQDSTHITFGVITAGYSFGKVKFEASAFNGSEPNENRWNFDKPKLNSVSGRISWNPTRELALQFSHGYLKNPEESEPDVKILRRTTASIIYNKRLNDNNLWANTFVWGQNYANGERTDAYLFESDYRFNKNSIFGRLETVQKSAHDLSLSHFYDHKLYNVSAFSIGYVRDIFSRHGLDVGVGAQETFNHNPDALNPIYGGNNHHGFQLFFRIRPSPMKGS